ncbi:MAG: alpha/beta fold hydrolase [Vicinamibacterales bacterium]
MLRAYQIEPFTFSSGSHVLPATLYPAAADPTGAGIVLAPGAGANQRHTFMTALAAALADRGIAVLTFDFPYMAERRRRPDPTAVLEAAWRDAIAFGREHLPSSLLIGGKSMGGRLATHVAANTAGLGIEGVVCLGYPLRPPGRDIRPVDHLRALSVPVLILQGTRDVFGDPSTLAAALGQGSRVEIVTIEGADHGFGRPKALTRTSAPVVDLLADLALEWTRRVLA